MPAPPRQTPEVCPVCGEDVPRNARACPACGADERSGWREDAHADGLDLPDGEGEPFDHDRFVREEFGGGVRPANVRWRWWVVGIVLFLLFLLGSLGWWR